MARPLVMVGEHPELDRMEELLAEWGWACLRAAPEEVTATLARTKPPLVILELPSGQAEREALVRLSQRIRATAYGALVPMLFLGQGPEPNPAEVMALGGDGFVPLPIEPALLKDAVDRFAPSLGEKRPSVPTSPGRAQPMAASSREVASPRQVMSLGISSGEDPDLDALGKLPWEDLPEVDSTRRSLAGGLGVDDLDQVMAHDAFLDLRTMAQAIAQGTPAERPVTQGEQAPHRDMARNTAKPSARPSPDLGKVRHPDVSGEPPLPTPPPEDGPADGDLPDPLEISGGLDHGSHIVEELAFLRGSTDTVAVRIQKLIHAHDTFPPFPESAPADVPEPAQWAHHDLSSRMSRARPVDPPEPRKPSDAFVDDDIDLAALDMDTVAGVDAADPDELMHRLSDRPEPTHTPLPEKGGLITTGSGASPVALPPPDRDVSRSRSRVGSLPGSHTGSIPGPLTGSIPGPLTGSIPGPLTGSIPGPLTSSAAQGLNPEEDRDSTQPPWKPDGHAASGGDPASGHPFVVERGFVEDPDTVPGRRTAILQGVTPDADWEDSASELVATPLADVTQPQSPMSRRRGRTRSPDGEEAPEKWGGRKPAPGETAAVARMLTPPPVPAHLSEGRLEDLDPARLLWNIGQLGLTGTLRVQAPQGAIDLVFVEGNVRFATSSRPGDRMLAVLLRRGQISATHAAEVEEEILRTGRRAGAILLDRGWIKSTELIPTIREHLEHLVMELFALERGSFRFLTEIPSEDEIVHIERSLPALLIAGVRLKYLPERIMGLVGGTEATPLKLTESDETLLAGCPLSGRDWRLMDAMDGRHTVTELCQRLEAPAHHLWPLCWSLRCMGLVALPLAGSTSLSPQERAGEVPTFEVEIRRIHLRRDLVKEGDYYALLGLTPEATPAEIEAAYHRGLHDLKPPALPALLAERYAGDLAEIRAVLTEAAEVLLDDRLRERYRRHLVPVASESERS